MMFHHHRKSLAGKIPNLFINNLNIERVHKFNFLGIIFDENLNWKHHLDMISNKLARSVGIINKLKNYLKISILKILYSSLFLPHLNYGLLLWGFNCERLSKLQKKALRTITKSKYNSHTEPLF